MSEYDDDLPNAVDGWSDDLDVAVYNAENDAAEAKRLAEKWATECEHMLRRITALEAEVEKLARAKAPA